MAVTAPPTERLPSQNPSIALSEPRGWTLTLEQVLYLVIGVLAIISRLYLLGDRALHHDETLHAAYSWRIYQGHGYVHDPLLHGPFLYYFTALQYFLFGDTDFTARLGAALFGIALVLLPWLLRRDLGRSTALIASVYLLLSPVTLYVSRFLRHDIFTVVFELLTVAAILRYVATERPIWHYILAAAMGLMLATMETFYLFLLIVGSFVMLWVLWQVSRTALALLIGYTGVAIFALKVLPRWFGPVPLPTPEQALLVRHQPNNDLGAYFSNVATVIRPMVTHPAGLIVLFSTIVLGVGLIWLLFLLKGTDGRSAWRRVADRSGHGTLVGALDRIPLRQWAGAFGIAFAIYAVFYTALISNPLTPNTAGLVTGVSGSFLYWLGQHEVQRGNQPEHYYLFQLSLYEPLLLLFSLVGLVLFVWLAVRLIRGSRTYEHRAVPSTLANALFAPALLLWWSVGALLIYSWAGEKMPWLTIHLVLPLTLFSAWACARLWAWATHDGVDSLTLGLTLMTGVLLVLCYNRFVTSIGVPEAVRMLAIWPILALAFMSLLAAGLTLLYRSARPALFALTSLSIAFLLVFTIRSSMRLAYVTGDVAVEPQVFVQTSPDVPRVLEQLRRASVLRTGKLDLPIRYDNETIWDWYLRNYTRTEGSRGTRLSTVDEDVQVILMLNENVSANEPLLDGFVRQRYPLRWWLPECEVYRLPQSDPYCGHIASAESLLSRMLSNPLDGQSLADYWQFAMDRKLPAPIGSTDWVLFVRPELAAEFGISAVEEP